MSSDLYPLSCVAAHVLKSLETFPQDQYVQLCIKKGTLDINPEIAIQNLDNEVVSFISQLVPFYAYDLLCGTCFLIYG